VKIFVGILYLLGKFLKCGAAPPPVQFQAVICRPLMTAPQKIHHPARIPESSATSAGQSTPPSVRAVWGLKTAFTLIELLVVMLIIALLLAFLVPAFTSIKGAGDVTKIAYDITGLLDQARAYAMGNSTYVFVGLVEVDASKDTSVTPQTTTANPTVGGRIAVAVIASKDGTRGYDANSPGAWVTNYSSATAPATTTLSNLVAISKLQRFENAHMPPLYSTLPTTGNMTRNAPSGGTYMLGNVACISVTPFDWPLGSALGAGQYSFTKVINFDPQGVARIQYSGSSSDIVDNMEIGLQPTHGTALSTTNPVAIQIDGMSGATSIYRP
jgi:prepilin-type N-terminal cleavage/methylation domain-containing protein